MESSEPNSQSFSIMGLEELTVEEMIEIINVNDADTNITLSTPVDPKLLPRPVPILLKKKVSGRYRSSNGSYQLELRVDVDGLRPMRMVSGDYYITSGSTTSYFGSFRVDSITLSVTPTTVIIEGVGTFMWTTNFSKIRVTIPRRFIFQPNAQATVQWFTTSGLPGATYICSFKSIYFRAVQLERDCETGITQFSSYNTGSLPSGGSARTLGISSAYAEAGIEMPISPASDVVLTAEAGANLKWSNAELHNAMVKHFSFWKDDPQWKVWLLAANEHEMGSGLYGIMFDQQEKQRQGCAVFHVGIGGASADKLRLQIYTNVHELGHCFNLLHSWQKSYATPSVPNRPNALSWMNYPWYYPGGATAFWSAFAFQFDDQEVIHLRHAYRNNVIMGGNNFIVGSALESLQDAQVFATPLEDKSGLHLELELPKDMLLYGEPVVVEIKLSTVDKRGKRVHTYLHPNTGLVQVAIRKPSGHVMLYKPLFEHHVVPNMVTLDEKHPTIYDSAYIGYGSNGLYFDQEGLYHIRAAYYALDGSVIVSNILTVRVRSPHNATDDEIASLFLGDEQGTLLYLLGSDSEFLKNGNKAFDEVIEKYSSHPLATYARFIKGYNEGCAFKSITSDKRISIREPRLDKCSSLFSAVIDASETGKGLDNITLNMAMRHLARAQKSIRKENEAKDTMKHMIDIFSKKKLKPHVMELIEAQAKQTLGP